MRVGSLRGALLAGALCVSMGPVATQADATALGPWHEIAKGGVSDISEVGLARATGGTLHAAWASQVTAGSESLETVPISAAGVVGHEQAIVSRWDSLEDPALGLAPGGRLQAFFGGIHTTSPSDPNSDMNLATSAAGGPWSLMPADVVAPNDGAYQSLTSVSNSFAPQASPFETWSGSPGVFVHRGLSSSTPNSNYQAALGGCCGYYSNIATDGKGATELAWYSNASGRGGVWTQGVSSSGAPIGVPKLMPNTGTLGVGELQRTPLVATHGAFYVVYTTGSPTVNAVEIWRIGGAEAEVSGLNGGIGTIAASAAVDQAGRVWVFWSNYVGGGTELYATRSNPKVTKFGPIVSVGAPKGTSSVYAVEGNASAGALDIFATTSPNSGGETIWTRHIYPGLTASISPASATLNRLTTIRVTVTDAGVPVKGATVRLGPHQATTNAAGRATFRVKVTGTLIARVTRPGYLEGGAELTVAS